MTRLDSDDPDDVKKLNDTLRSVSSGAPPLAPTPSMPAISDTSMLRFTLPAGAGGEGRVRGSAGAPDSGVHDGGAAPWARTRLCADLQARGRLGPRLRLLDDDDARLLDAEDVHLSSAGG